MPGKQPSMRTPTAVQAAYAELKRRYGFPVSLKRISGHYYLYKQLIRWDREAKKYRCVEMRYLGSISDAGAFKPRKMERNDIESAKAVIAAHGGRVVMPESQAARPGGRLRITELDRKILTELTMDGRIQVSELARRLGAEERSVGNRMRSLERSLGMEYRPKVLLEGLGYLFFIVFAKFRDRRPDPDHLEREMNAFPSVQFAALSSNSKYDLVLIIATINDYNAVAKESLPVILRKIRMSPAVKDIEAEWYVSYFDISKGFMPLRQIFVEERLKGSIWTRRQEKGSGSLSKNEYATLLALNADGAESFRAIEKRNGMSDGSARYSYDSLVERKVLTGVTVCMKSLPTMYNALLLVEIVDEGAYAATRNEVYRIEITEDPGHIANRIPLAANMGAPYGVIFMVPILRDGDLENLEREFYAKVKGIKLSSMVLTKTLCGTPPYNRFDNTKSFQYEMLNAKVGQKNL